MFLTVCPYFDSVMNFWWDNCVKPHLCFRPIIMHCWNGTCGSLFMSIMWWIEPVIINPGILSGSWTVSPRAFDSGPSNRGLLVKHDVPVGKITAEVVAWECALGLYTKNAVTLHQSCMMDKLDWSACESEWVGWEHTPMLDTPLQTYMPMCRRQWVWVAFRSVTVFNIIALHVLSAATARLVPALWPQGLPLFFTPNADIITSFKEPPHLTFSPSLSLLVHLLYPHLRICMALTEMLIQDSIFCIQLQKCLTTELHTYTHRPLCLQSIAFCVSSFRLPLIPFIHQKVWLSRAVCTATKFVFPLITWAPNVTPALVAIKNLTGF